MLHLIKYRLIQTIRKTDSIFWSMMFPFALCLLFYFSFMGGGEKKQSIDPVPAAVVIQDKSEEAKAFRTFTEQMDEELLNTRYMTGKKAKTALLEGTVKGIFYASKEGRKLEVSASGLEEGILETLLDSYNQNEAMFREIASQHPERLKDALENLELETTRIEAVSLGGKTADGKIQFFFALIGMSCLYGCFIGLQAALDLKANLSALGARRSISPTRRISMILCDMAVTLLIQFGTILLLLLFMKYVLKLEFNGSFAGMALVCLFGCTIGVGSGISVGSLGKASEMVKSGILIAGSMICSFLAGLMATEVKYIVEQNIPFLNRINPAALISDAFYCLAVFDDKARYTRDLVTLAALSILCILVSFLAVRREQYENI